MSVQKRFARRNQETNLTAKPQSLLITLFQKAHRAPRKERDTVQWKKSSFIEQDFKKSGRSIPHPPPKVLPVLTPSNLVSKYWRNEASLDNDCSFKSIISTQKISLSCLQINKEDNKDLPLIYLFMATLIEGINFIFHNHLANRYTRATNLPSIKCTLNLWVANKV